MGERGEEQKRRAGEKSRMCGRPKTIKKEKEEEEMKNAKWKSRERQEISANSYSASEACMQPHRTEMAGGEEGARQGGGGVAPLTHTCARTRHTRTCAHMRAGMQASVTHTKYI